MKFGPEAAGRTDTKLKMTPMIDVVFLLLIFFLVGTKFRVPEGELQAYLPRDERRPTPESAIRVTLMVSQAGATNPNVPPAIRLDDTEVGSLTDSGTSMYWLERKLYLIVGTNKAMLQKVPVIIEAEPHLAYRWVIATLDLCRKIGFHKVNFAPSERNAPEPDKKAWEGETKQPVLIAADRNAKWGTIQDIMERASKMQFWKLSFSVKLKNR